MGMRAGWCRLGASGLWVPQVSLFRALLGGKHIIVRLIVTKKGRTMRCAGIALAGLLLAATSHGFMSRVVHAEAALAIGQTSNPMDGESFATAQNYLTKEDAQRTALRDCQNNPNTSPKVNARCKVAATFKRECYAVALTARVPGFGWAVASTIDAARQRALSACEPTGKGQSCYVNHSGCDTEDKARYDPNVKPNQIDPSKKQN